MVRGRLARQEGLRHSVGARSQRQGSTAPRRRAAQLVDPFQLRVADQDLALAEHPVARAPVALPAGHPQAAHGHLAFFGAYVSLNLAVMTYAVPYLLGRQPYNQVLNMLSFWVMSSAMARTSRLREYGLNDSLAMRPKLMR